MTDQPHNMARQSTPDSVLLSQLMDPNLAKNEREWFAAAEIKRLTAENERLTAYCSRVKAELSAIRAGGSGAAGDPTYPPKGGGGGAGIGYTPRGGVVVSSYLRGQPGWAGSAPKDETPDTDKAKVLDVDP